MSKNLGKKEVKLYELELKHLGIFLIAIAIVLRPYIFNFFNVKGILAHVVYFLLLMVIVVPLNIYQPRFTLSSLDTKSSKKLIEELLKTPLFEEFENIENVNWKPYLVDKKLYNIKATISKNSKLYHIYLQPTCNFFKGCTVGLDKIMIVNHKYESISIEKITEETFLQRDCRDIIVQNILDDRIKFAIKTYSENMNKVPNIKFKYDIKSLQTMNFKESSSKPLQAKMAQNYKFSNSCSADFILKSLFTIGGQSKKGLNLSLSTMFDNVKEEENNMYIISSKVNYDIYLKNGEFFVQAMPFNMNKMKKLKLNIENKIKEKKDLVIHKKTHLMWQNAIFTKKEIKSSNQNKNHKKTGDFDYAVQYCKNSTFADFKDWRLPSKKEFKTIRDVKNEKNNYFKNIFTHTYPMTYWTIETDKRDKLWGWGISMTHEGEFYLLKKKYSSFILCVRNNK